MNQNIDRLIQGIRAIIENRCSLLDEEVKLLNDVVEQLEVLKGKSGQDNAENLLMVLRIVEILAKIFFLTNAHS